MGKWQGGLEVGPDGRIRATYNHNPSTLRLASSNPNVQVWPRGKTPEAKLVKGLVIAQTEYTLVEIDFAAIEAVLVGYFAQSREYIRLSKLGIHDYVLSHMLHRAGKTDQPADLTLGDSDLKAFYKDLKSKFNGIRDVAKRVVHMSSYGGTPSRMHQTDPHYFPTIKAAKELQDLFFDVCPDVRRWQEHTVALADKQGYLRNPYGYLHRFWNVRSWHKERDGRWVASWAEDAKRALAFMPQSTAAGIIKEAMLRLQHTAVMPTLRLQVHDSLLCEVPTEQLTEICRILRSEMEKPIEQLPLNPEWGMGDFLVIGTESKAGCNWGEMEVL
jgi:DNA polymerase I-like protein with 3'-5' exonuclease and polymerase domains